MDKVRREEFHAGSAEITLLSAEMALLKWGKKATKPSIVLENYKSKLKLDTTFKNTRIAF